MECDNLVAINIATFATEMTINVMLPSGTNVCSESIDATASVNFLKISSMQWLPKLKASASLRATLERAWVRYALRGGHPSPRTFLEWITLMRDKSVRSGSETFTFTIEHFDHLLRYLVDHLTKSSERIVPAITVPKSKPKTVPTPSVEKSVERISKPKQRKVHPAPKRKAEEVLGSQPKKDLPSKSSQRAKRVKATKPVGERFAEKRAIIHDPNRSVSDFVSNSPQVCVAPGTLPRDRTSPVRASTPPVVIDETEYRDFVAEKSANEDDESVSTFATLRDADIERTKRIKRAIVRMLVCGRKCSCQFYKDAVANTENDHLSRVCLEYSQALPDPTPYFGDGFAGKTGFLTGGLSLAQNLIPCNICAIAVGTGVPTFVWILG